MKLRIAILQPPGAVHAACFAELAEMLHHACVALGHESSWGYNGLIQDGTNILLGWHQSMDHRFPPGTVIFNLEQLGKANPAFTERLVYLQNRYQVWDYSQSNIDALRAAGFTEPIELMKIGHMPQMSRIPKAEVQDIDVLFYGSINERRAKVLTELKQRGLKVIHVFGVYGAERDELISRAKVVLNMHYYEPNIFEVVRVSYLLSNEKVVVTEADAACEIEDDYYAATNPCAYDQLVDQCCRFVGDANARKVLEDYAEFVMATRWQDAYLAGPLSRLREPMPPPRINLGSGKDWRLGYLNVDCNDAWNPDVVVDIASKEIFGKGKLAVSAWYGPRYFLPGIFQEIIANDVLEHLPNLSQAMTNCLDLLEDGGLFKINVPYDLALGAWQDPTHVRAFNEMSWTYYTDWWWYMGWKTHRFDQVELNLVLSEYGRGLKKPVAEIIRIPRAVDSMQVTLKKRRLTVKEKLEGERLRGEDRSRVLVNDCQIPVFIINRNRLEPLRKMVDWLVACGMRDIRIIDNASTYPPLMEYYRTGISSILVKVYMGSNNGPWAVWDQAIFPEDQPYIVTDADLDPTGCPHDMIPKMLDYVMRFPECGKVGAGLRISDIPDHYKHKAQVLEWEGQFWKKPISPELFEAPVDTTFAIYPAGAGFSNGPHNLRMNEPYCMRHEPWYCDEANLSEEEIYYREHADPRFSHWSFGGVK